MLEINCIKKARNTKSTFDLSWTIDILLLSWFSIFERINIEILKCLQKKETKNALTVPIVFFPILDIFKIVSAYICSLRCSPRSLVWPLNSWRSIFFKFWRLFSLCILGKLSDPIIHWICSNAVGAVKYLPRI